MDKDLSEYDVKLAKMQLDFAQFPIEPLNIEWVKKKLNNMVEIDQHMRLSLYLPFKHQYNEEEKTYFSMQIYPRAFWVDAQNTAYLKLLLMNFPWFKISQFGAKADGDAWLIVQHADDHPEFQKEVLAILEGLYKEKETNPRNYAYLYDRVAASYKDPSKSKLQRYCTQGNCVGPGQWEPNQMEDPEKVDERRATVGLPPMSEYKKPNSFPVLQLRLRT